MNMLGLCHICGKPAAFMCRICHEPVCADHITPAGICVACREKHGGLAFPLR